MTFLTLNQQLCFLLVLLLSLNQFNLTITITTQFLQQSLFCFFFVPAATLLIIFLTTHLVLWFPFILAVLYVIISYLSIVYLALDKVISDHCVNRLAIY